MNNASREKGYWVVSPNVRNDNKTVAQWKIAMKTSKVVFMGYAADDTGHKKIGYKFAHQIKPGDIVLIARRYKKIPELVGCGVVKGTYKRHKKNLRVPGAFGSLRNLAQFVPLKQVPANIPIMKVLQHTVALRQLNTKRASHRLICKWLEERLSVEGSSRLGQQPNTMDSNSKNAAKVSLPFHRQLEYQIRTTNEVKSAQKREAKLVQLYTEWLRNKGRTVATIKQGYLACDLYEEKSCNLIEAKASVGREYIRMAVGQLFDYAYLSRKIVKRPNLAILLPKKPAQDAVIWLRPLKVGLIWKEKSGFKDNAGGRFS